MNKKIKNATPSNNSGIEFKSKLEASIYKALVSLGIHPKYEEETYILSNSIRPTIPFYNRISKKTGFCYDMRPISKITYTPDFTFDLNHNHVIVEVKGMENDVYPLKKNLFRKQLESMSVPTMYFEVRSKKELLEAINIVKMESPLIKTMRKYIPFLPEKDIPLANKFLEKRDFDSLEDLVSSAMAKVANSRGATASKESQEKYKNIKYENLVLLNEAVLDYLSKL